MDNQLVYYLTTTILESVYEKMFMNILIAQTSSSYLSLQIIATYL